MSPYPHRRPLLLLLTPLLVLLMLFSLAVEAKTAPGGLHPRQVRSHKQLLRILAQHSTHRFYYGYGPMTVETTVGGGIPIFTDGVFSVDMEASPTPAVSHSDTNLQVAGVDEADSVKAGDDGYISRIRDARVQIIAGLPPSQPAIAATLDFSGKNFHPTGLYREGKRLVILGNQWEDLPPQDDGIYAYPWWGGRAYAGAKVYDLTDPARPSLEREVSVEGYALDSRKIGQAVYLLARTYPRFYMLAPAVDRSIKRSQLLPVLRDSAVSGGAVTTLPLRKVSYLPGFVEPDYAVIAGFRLDRPEQPADVQAYLGAGEMVYASTTHLYLSAAQYHFAALGRELLDQPAEEEDRETTRIFRFAIEDGKSRFLAAGRVPGRILNQFSMDEEGEYFRVATTRFDRDSGQNTSGLYVLDQDMRRVGSVDGLAPGEQIYAVRFLGKRCYLVTFRLIDPLFAIDLSDPTRPAVLGELKIPGYSNYLHPYDETHLLGFGKDAKVVSPENGGDQVWAGGGAFYQGMKLSLFDVSDVAHPREQHSLIIGDRGTDSSLLYDHKALFQHPERHLFGFPLQIARIAGKTPATPPWEYGQVEFVGAQVYEVTPERGFVLKAAISHQLEGEPTGYWWNWNRQITRLLSIESSLYTLSPDLMQVHEMDAYSRQGELTLGQDSGEGWLPYGDVITVTTPP